jgi:hypothetical protein
MSVMEPGASHAGPKQTGPGVDALTSASAREQPRRRELQARTGSPSKADTLSGMVKRLPIAREDGHLRVTKGIEIRNGATCVATLGCATILPPRLS